MRVSYYMEDPHGAGIKVALYPESVKDKSSQGEPLFSGELYDIPEQYEDCEVVEVSEVLASTRENYENFRLYIKDIPEPEQVEDDFNNVIDILERFESDSVGEDENGYIYSSVYADTINTMSFSLREFKYLYFALCSYGADIADSEEIPENEREPDYKTVEQELEDINKLSEKIKRKIDFLESDYPFLVHKPNGLDILNRPEQGRK